MTVAQALAAYMLAAGLLTITPGLDTALILRTAAVEGPKRAVLAALGINIGCLVWGGAVALGLGALLQASAMVALARLGDRQSVAAIEDQLASSRIPRVRISAAYSLELLGSRGSVPVLVSCLRRERDPAFVSDELLLSTAAIVGIMPRFYGLYQSFLEGEAAGLSALGDIAAGTFGDSGSQARTAFDAALAGILGEPCDGVPMGLLILERGSDSAGDSWATDIVLAEAALDPGPGYRGFRFLIAAYVLLRA